MVWSRQEAPSPVQTASNQAARPKICIGIPYEPRITMYWGLKMLVPLLSIKMPWADKTFGMAGGIPLAVARDQIVEGALSDPDVTHIMWIDTDIVPLDYSNPFDAIKLLYDRNEPIVSGLYRAKQKVGFNYAMWMDEKLDKPSFHAVESFTGNWLQVDVAGMGFMLVKREVYEKLPKPWHPWPTISPSEDFNFCMSARKNGYKVNVFTDVRLRHGGDMVVNPDGSFQIMSGLV